MALNLPQPDFDPTDEVGTLRAIARMADILLLLLEQEAPEFIESHTTVIAALISAQRSLALAEALRG